MRRLEGRVALITGAAGDIGAATARRFTEEGASVALVDLSEDALKGVAETLPDGAAHRLFALDVSDEGAVQGCITETLAAFGRLDILFNNAGVLCRAAPIGEQDAADWMRVLGVNVIGAMLFMKHVSGHMTENRRGAIINTASVAGIRAGAGGNAYSASKAAIINMTQTAACDFGAFGVRVNAICPGLIETGMTRPVFDHARAVGKEEKLGSRCELRRYGRPEEIAPVVAFLASDDASYITGQALAVDGGNTASLNLPGMKF